MKVKKGDKVKVITGKFKGNEGIVNQVLPRKQKVVVEGVNVKKRSLKTKGSENSENFIYLTHPVHVSNVKVVGTGAEEKPEKAADAKPKKKKSVRAKSK